MDPETTLVGSDRLDSWKAVAEYLGRDVATVRRWEKTGGLPVRRVAGSRGHSVFAYRSEIDAWLKKTPCSLGSTSAPTSDPVRNSSPTSSLNAVPAIDAALPPARLRSAWQWWLAASAIGLALVSIAWPIRMFPEAGPLQIDVRPEAIVARGADGVERWRHAFPPAEQFDINARRPGAEVFTGQHPGIVVGSMQRFSIGSDATKSGQLLRFSPTGALLNTFTFDDRVTYGTETYGAPWIMDDYRAERSTGTPRFATSAHHFHWWPSIVAILDAQLNRRGTFVNAGWVEYVHWMSPDRLLIAGFSNPRDGGMVAILDANASGGQSPAADGTAFKCTSCPAGSPLRYVVLPRSEVNRVSVSPFNRVVLQMMGDRLIARTVEAPPEFPSTNGGAIDALYEFSPSLDLIRASYSDRYWEVHRALELKGKINHTRDRCPDRDGPRSIEVWEPTNGWKTITIRH